MKKLYIIITLFVSSFFLFNSDVKAEEYVCSEDRMSFINDNFLLYRQKVIDYSNFNNYQYIISYWEYGNKYITIFFTSSLDSFSIASRYEFNSNTINNPSSIISNIKYVEYYENELATADFSNIEDRSSFSISFTNFLLFDLSFSIYYIGDSEPFTFTCNNKSFIFDDNNKYLSLYDLYLSNIPLDNSHQEEINKLESFYTLCIEKLSYLGDKIVSNYIYLSILAIFIFIFVVELIRRRCI